jgi:hypothetical protein
LNLNYKKKTKKKQKIAEMAATITTANLSSDYLSISGDKCETNKSDSGIVYDSLDDDKSCSGAINIKKADLLKCNYHNDSGADSISKISSLRDFTSKQSLTKCASAASVTNDVSLSQEISKKRHCSKRYSLPDVDKLKVYGVDVKQKFAKNMNSTLCDNKDMNRLAPNMTSHIPLVPTETKPLNVLAKQPEKPDTCTIDPKLINKFDGLSQSIYYIDENGSPKIRERFIKQQRMMIEKQEQRKRDKTKNDEGSEATCSCFNFSRLSKKLKLLCKLRNFHLSWP